MGREQHPRQVWLVTVDLDEDVRPFEVDVDGVGDDT